MRQDAARDEPETANEQHQHHNGVEEAQWPEEDVQIGKNSGEDEESAGDGQNPSNDAPAAPEEQPNAEEHGQKRDSEGVFAVEIPIGAHHGNLIDQQVSANANHDEAQQKMTEAAGRSACVAE